MKKRIFSVVLSLVLVLASIATAFAAPIDIEDAADIVYEGNKPFILAEKILDELNEDKEADIFDQESHVNQFNAIESLNVNLATLIPDDLDDAINHLTANMSDVQKMYLYAQVKAESDSAFKSRLDAVDPVGGLPLKESFGLLDNYIEDMKVFFNDENINVDLYNGDPAVQQSARAIVAEPLIAILKIMFAQDGTADNTSEYTESGKYMRENYLKEFIANDRAKKTLSVLFGAELTEEIVKDSFLSDVENNNQQSGTIGIVHHVKKYLIEDAPAIRNLKEAIENEILVADGETSVNASFDVIGELVTSAYEHDANASDNLKAQVKMLMGDGNQAGLLELMISAVDDDDYTVSNIWINLFLSEFVQMEISPSRKLTTVNAVNPEVREREIRNGSNVAFKNENVSDFGITDGKMNFRTGKFFLRFFAEDPAHPGTYAESNFISCDENGKITVDRDPSQPDEYKAFITMYRADYQADDSTFIESYPVTVVNPRESSGGGGSAKVFLRYETNGGEPISSTSHTRGTTVQLTVVPVREGYIFTGWYSDPELTNKIETVVMDATKTVYAGWKKDGSQVVSKVDVPEQLNGEDHFAYVVGYPDGSVRPQANITRAETVTILFRLLKDDVRNANLTTANVFTDVNDGDWYNTAVSTLAALGIVNGRTETEFMPNEYITRAEFATIFARFSEYNYTVDDEFRDIAGHWAKDYINEAAAYGWIAGYEDNTFRPDNRITRAEAMTLINRVLKRNPETANDLLTGMTVWTDNTNTSAWYYIAVQEATNSHKYVMKDKSYEQWTELTENRDWTTFEK